MTTSILTMMIAISNRITRARRIWRVMRNTVGMYHMENWFMVMAAGVIIAISLIAFVGYYVHKYL